MDLQEAISRRQQRSPADVDPHEQDYGAHEFTSFTPIARVHISECTPPVARWYVYEDDGRRIRAWCASGLQNGDYITDVGTDSSEFRRAFLLRQCGEIYEVVDRAWVAASGYSRSPLYARVCFDAEDLLLSERIAAEVKDSEAIFEHFDMTLDGSLHELLLTPFCRHRLSSFAVLSPETASLDPKNGSEDTWKNPSDYSDDKHGLSDSE